MTSLDKLQELISRCKYGVYITVNAHRDYYRSAAEALEENILTQSVPPEIEPEVRAKMIELNTIVEVHFYPDSPVGFYEIYHYDMDEALTQALACLDVPDVAKKLSEDKDRCKENNIKKLSSVI